MPGTPAACHSPVRPLTRILGSVLPILLFGLASSLVGISTAAAQPPAWIADELLVGFHAGVTDTEAENTYRAHGGHRLQKLWGTNVHRVRVRAADLAAIEQSLANRPQVRFVERNHLHPPVAIPNDPWYPGQWHLPMISAPAAWDLTQGSAEVIVAILDSGVDAAHPDLSEKLVPGYNFWDGNTNTADVYGHGTKVAGAAAATGDNGLGVASVAWRSSIMPIRVTGTDGWASTSAIATGLTWAVDHGARVMNLSFGSVAGSSTIRNAAQYVVGHGGVVVAGAGNCGCWDATPDNPYIISVSATTSSDDLASWSSRGDYVDIAAPGVSITTTSPGGSYTTVSGTSFASPITAGVVALMLSANPSLTPIQVETLLLANADDRGPVGWDSSFGAGRVNALRAVIAAAESSPASDTTPPTVDIASPSEGSTLAGGVAVSISASDDTGVARVDLYVDGTIHASDTTAPHSIFWDTRNAADGGHTLMARAFDAAGNAATSATVSVLVSNVLDATAPSVSITSLAVNRHWLTVGVSASDNLGVSKVELLVDGVVKATDTSTPHSFRVDAKSLAAGAHTAQARAYDGAGNVAISTPVGFSITGPKSTVP